jgi:hypothetical protein
MINLEERGVEPNFYISGIFMYEKKMARLQFCVYDINETAAKKKMFQWFNEWATHSNLHYQQSEDDEDEYEIFDNDFYIASFIITEWAIGSAFFTPQKKLPLAPEVHAATPYQKEVVIDQYFPSVAEIYKTISTKTMLAFFDPDY